MLPSVITNRLMPPWLPWSAPTPPATSHTMCGSPPEAVSSWGAGLGLTLCTLGPGVWGPDSGAFCWDLHLLSLRAAGGQGGREGPALGSGFARPPVELAAEWGL